MIDARQVLASFNSWLCGCAILKSPVLILGGDAVMMATFQISVLEGSYAVVFVEDFWLTDPQLLHPAAFFGSLFTALILSVAANSPKRLWVSLG
ncbi:hypothetical protein [Pseudomonas granadensis]|uniref:hypothetical protein n=1 Tax=Pseudomonas granadensis TaxID=1421430 RepID=UPI001EF0EF5A|nr:hypothetical protein [Pseudomonas granadensis]